MKTHKPIFLLLFLLLLALPVRAADEAHCVNASCDMRIYGEYADTLLDGNLRSHSKVHKGTELSISSSELIGGLYLEFSAEPGEYTLLCGGKTISCGANGFLHQYISDLNAYSLTLRFQGEGILANVYALSPGERPEWVQDWKSVCEKADVLLLPTHSDDDTLFFGGIIPWCLDRGASVQVAYLINHDTELFRCNELLNGLWTSGLRNYPVLGSYPDLGTEEDPQKQLSLYQKEGISYEDMLRRQIRLYRQFRPQVVICHDSEGEYGHGAHKLYYMLCVNAIEKAADGSIDASSAARFGVWSPSKVYVHLLRTGAVTIDLDEPLRSFDYKTPYEITQKAYACHQSQYDFFSWYFWGAPTAAELQQYSSRQYGLYYSSVGNDTSGKSFFDNLTLYAEPPSEEPSASEEPASAATPDHAEENLSVSSPLYSAVTSVNPKLDEIRSEQRRLTLCIAALVVCVLTLLGILMKMKNKEHKKS